jgi:hypothetical protein
MNEAGDIDDEYYDEEEYNDEYDEESEDEYEMETGMSHQLLRLISTSEEEAK